MKDLFKAVRQRKKIGFCWRKSSRTSKEKHIMNKQARSILKRMKDSPICPMDGSIVCEYTDCLYCEGCEYYLDRE